MPTKIDESKAYALGYAAAQRAARAWYDRWLDKIVADTKAQYTDEIRAQIRADYEAAERHKRNMGIEDDRPIDDMLANWKVA